jgi:hypothetical protein
MNFKLFSTISLFSLLTAASLQAVVASLPGSISFTANANGTVSTAVLRGKNFSVPATATVNIIPYCTIETIVTLFQIFISVPVTFTCPCSTTPIVTLGLESNNVILPPNPVIDITPFVSAVTTTGFTVNILIQVSGCNDAPVTLPQIIAVLTALGTSAVNFDASCVR